MAILGWFMFAVIVCVDIAIYIGVDLLFEEADNLQD